jgi:hypothetical protein
LSMFVMRIARVGMLERRLREREQQTRQYAEMGYATHRCLDCTFGGWPCSKSCHNSRNLRMFRAPRVRIANFKSTLRAGHAQPATSPTSQNWYRQPIWSLRGDCDPTARP